MGNLADTAEVLSVGGTSASDVICRINLRLFGVYPWCLKAICSPRIANKDLAGIDVNLPEY